LFATIHYFFIVHVATVDSALNTLYNNYLKVWAPLIGVIGVAIGGIMWILGSFTGNSAAGALGIRVAVICIIGVALVFGATDLINIGKGLNF
jgi:type IV secretory pathway VirB2 component (pilin)